MTTSDISLLKKKLRQEMLRQRNLLTPYQRADYSGRICSQLWKLITEKKVQYLHTYLPIGSEVNIMPLLEKALKEGITVVSTQTLRHRQLKHLVIEDLHHVEKGIFGTYYPKDAKEYTGSYDMILVPGLAFDKAGHRLGYGGGYYDGFLYQHSHAWKVGIAFPFQLLENIPVENHDAMLDSILC